MSPAQLSTTVPYAEAAVVLAAKERWNDEELICLTSYLRMDELLRLKEFLTRLNEQSSKTYSEVIPNCGCPSYLVPTINSLSHTSLDTPIGAGNMDLILGLKYFRAVSGLRGIAGCATADPQLQDLSDIARRTLEEIGEPR